MKLRLRRHCITCCVTPLLDGRSSKSWIIFKISYWSAVKEFLIVEFNLSTRYCSDLEGLALVNLRFSFTLINNRRYSDSVMFGNARVDDFEDAKLSAVSASSLS